MNTQQEDCDPNPNKLFVELHMLVEAEEVRKTLKKTTMKTAVKPRPFVSFPELAFPFEWCSPAALEELPPVAAPEPVATPAFDREGFFGIEINTVTRSPTGVVEMIGFRSADADGYVTYQTMYCDPRPLRYATTSNC